MTDPVSLGPNARVDGDVFTGPKQIYNYNYFTAGMEALPTRYDARVRNFLEYYVGTPSQPAPFGGRAADLAALDAWLADAATPPYALLAAPAGRGKSGLLAHWVTRLAAAQIMDPGAARRWHIVFFPISVRFNTNLESVVFAGLAARLAHVYGEPVGAINDVQQYRGLFSEYLRRAPPDGAGLLIVLDGLDEAAGWEAAADLFPYAPPAHLRVLAAARLLAGDPDGSAWLSRLGWDPPGRARRLALLALDQAGVADVLAQMGDPLGALAANSSLVTKLVTLSQGDPLLVRLYVEALLPHAGQAAALTPTDLETLRPGLDAYFDRWFEEQRKLWGAANPLQDKRVRALLNLCAAALGPLCKDDVLALAPDVFDDSWMLNEAARAVNRFVLGDGDLSGYVFSHPRLDDYFWARLAPREQQAWLERFLRLGRELVAGLAAGTTAPAEASAYLVQYYGAHLDPHAADPPAPAVADLVAEGWLRAHEAVSGTPIGFLADARRAWRRAEADGPAGLGRQVRSALCFASVMSLSANLPPELLAACVAAGVMPLALGLVLARQKQQAGARALALAALIPHVPAGERPAVIAEAFEIAAPIVNGQPDALLALIDWLPPHLARRAESIVAESEFIAAPEVVLARLAARLPKPEAAEVRARALALARHVGYSPAELPGTLLAVLPHLPPAEQADVLRQALDYVPAIDDPGDRARAISGLSAHVPEAERPALLAQAFQAAVAVEWDEPRAEALLELAGRLPPDLRAQAQASLAEEFNRAAIPRRPIAKAVPAGKRTDEAASWAKLAEQYAPFLPEPDVQRAIAHAWTIDVVSIRAHALSALAARLPPAEARSLLEKLLASIQQDSEESTRLWALGYVVDHLPPDLAVLAVAAARTITNPPDRSQVLLRLAPRLNGASRASALAEALAAARALQDEPDRIRALAALAEHLPEPVRGETLTAAWRTVRALPAENQRLEACAGLAAHRLPEPVLDEMLADLAASTNDVYRVDAFEALAAQLSGARLGAALRAVRKVEYEAGRARSLLALAARLPAAEAEAVYAEAAEAARAVGHKGTRAETLIQVAAHVSPTLRPAAVDEAAEAVRAVRHPHKRAPWFASLADLAEGDQAHLKLMAAAFTALTEIPDETIRAEQFGQLAPRLPASFLPAALEAVAAFERDYDRSRALVGLAPYLTDETTWQTALSLARAIVFIDPQATALAALAAVRPPAEREPLLAEALEVTERQDDDDRPRVLLQMAGCLPPAEKVEVLRRAVAVVESPNAVTDVHAALVAALPEPERLAYARQLVGRLRAEPAALQPMLLGRVRAALPDAALAEALAVAWATGDVPTLSFAAPRWLAVCRAGGLDPLAALTHSLHACEQVARRDLLGLLVDLAPALAAAGGPDAVRDAAQAIVETGAWWP